MHQFRYALRILGKAPAFTAVAIVTLALGIGVNSGIFSIIDAAMIRPLPYASPERLVSMWETLTGDPPDQWNTSGSGDDPAVRMTVSPANLADYRKQNDVFSGIASWELIGMNLTEDGPPERLSGERVSANFFSVLGVEPVLGRAFRPEEEKPGNGHVVILSYGFWQEKLGADPEWAAKTLTLEGEKYRIVGIMPRGFESPAQMGTTDPLAFFVPAGYAPDLAADHSRHFVWTVARLRPGVSLRAAQTEMDAISARLAREHPKTNRNLKTAMAPLGDDLVRNARISLLVMLGAVGLVLLIACANLANLLLARAAGRVHEITIRFALGASRARVVGELLAQSAVLAAMGAAAGLALGIWTRELLEKLSPGGIPRVNSAGLDARVLLFTVLLSAITGIAFGIFPALQVSRAARPAEALKSNERGSAGAGVMRWRNALMAAEIAVSMILLVGAGLLIRSFVALNGVKLGFDTTHVMAMKIRLPLTRYPDATKQFAFFHDLADRVRPLPGVEAVGFANNLPMRGGWSSSFDLDSGEEFETDAQAVSTGYFATLGIPLLRGRLFTPADREDAPPVAVVNMKFARTALHNGTAIGRRMRWHKDMQWITIVGIVGDIRREGKAKEILPEVYLPAADAKLWPVYMSDFAFRSVGDPKLLVAAVERQVWAIDKDQPVTQVRTLDEVIARAASERRFQTTVLLLFALLALGLALVGVYGVISYAVTQRTGEMGVRIALGASRGDILKLVIGRAMLLVATGILAGAAGAYALSRSLQMLLFEIQPWDPLTYAALAVALPLVALAACYIPARRATRVDPMVALRYE